VARTVTLVFDEGAEVGLGHRRRMQALATALVARGIAVSMSSEGTAHDAGLVVDSYRWRADDRRHFRGDVIAAVDDLQRDIAADLVIDPSPGADPHAHQSARAVLDGPRFALLSPLKAGVTGRQIAPAVDRVLVTTGGGGETGLGDRVVTAVRTALDTRIAVTYAVAPWSKPRTVPGVETVQTEDGLDSLLADSDVVVTGAGVTMLESLRLGRPTIAMVIATNQARAAAGAARSGAVVLTGVLDVGTTVTRLVGCLDERLALGDSAHALVDGRGADRVADAIVQLL
jgi:spore coat polysaccharide biosynthesis predicted glycosyltransferase SpsG